MPLQIRCPHCRVIVDVDETELGAPTACRNCGGGFKLPGQPKSPPVPRVQPAGARGVSACPRCRADLAPGTRVCPRCLTDVQSGKRLKLSERLKRLSVRAWVTALLSVIGIAVVAAGIIEWRMQARPDAPSIDIGGPPSEGEPREVAAVRELLNARDAATRRSATDTLLRLGVTGYPVLAKALAKIDRPPVDVEGLRSVAAAIELLGRSGDSRYLHAIESFSQEALAETVLRTRGMLGDPASGEAVVEGWAFRLRRRLLFDRLADLTGTSNSAIGMILARERREYEKWAEAVRRLSAVGESRVVEFMLEKYWDSLNWLGQPRDERFVAELWEAAKPLGDQDLQLQHRVSAIRRVLDGASKNGSSSARAAAGIVLAQAGPQLESLRKEIIDAIAAGIVTDSPLARQRAVWALSRLGAPVFRGAGAGSAPADVDGEAVTAALSWAKNVGVGTGAESVVVPNTKYADPPIVLRRVITPARQHEAALLEDLERDWASAARAVAEWQGTELGFTPRLAALLDVRQRTPRYSSLVGAMCLAVAFDRASEAASLRQWTEARDQPGWVRGLAFTALAALDARAGIPTPGWPGGLTDDMLGDLDLGPPGMAPWAELIALAGRPMLDKLQSEELAISESARSRLFAAAEQTLRRRTTIARDRAPEP